MAQHRSHTAKKQLADHRVGSHPSRRTARRSRTLTRHSVSSMRSNRKQDPPAAMEWRLRLFEMMLMPWQVLTSPDMSSTHTEEWQDSGHALFPKTERRQTNKKYLYLVTLPAIARKQVALKLQDGAIMLHIEMPKGHKEKLHHHQSPHTIRRAFALPIHSDGTAITAKLKNELLTITIPKSDEPIAPRSQSINIS